MILYFSFYSIYVILTETEFNSNFNIQISAYALNLQYLDISDVSNRIGAILSISLAVLSFALIVSSIRAIHS